MDQVNYGALDKAKGAFIRASKETLSFAQRFGFVPDEKLGASANVFALDLKPFIANNSDKLYMTLLPEGLGTADDARPEDLSGKELEEFWHNIGLKTMSCLTNDAASTGMQTILISLYLPSSNPEEVFSPEFLKGFLGGFVSGCKRVGCVWISGETPQLKGKICEGKLDIAGALFGIMPAGLDPIDGTNLSAGNQIVLIESSGPHENGFTALRKLATQLPQGYRTKLSNGQEYWQAINAPSNLYTPLVQNILAKGIKVTSIENITGHGWQKLMRSQKPLRYVIEKMLPVPPVFEFVEKASGSSKKEMVEIFNYGAGCAIFVPEKSQADEVVKIAGELKLNAIHAGKVESAANREVVIEPISVHLGSDSFVLARE